LAKVCLWHLLEQGILNLRHEHRIVLHFLAQLHVDTRLAVIFSKDGILKTYYSDEDLVDLRTVCFPGLNSIDPNLLLKISHIQACQKNRTVNETANLVSTCN
jgi:hypothetical protein